MQGSLVTSSEHVAGVLCQTKWKIGQQKTFDKEIYESGYKTCKCNRKHDLIPLEDQMIQINVSVLYANTTGFSIIV